MISPILLIVNFHFLYHLCLTMNFEFRVSFNNSKNKMTISD